MSVHEIRKTLIQLGEDARKMRWSRELRSLSSLVNETTTAKDFFFEFWCYLATVKTIHKEVGKVNLELPSGQSHAVWPLKPGSPSNFSYFSFHVAKTSYGIYPGVKFMYKGIDSSFAPDISIRSVLGKSSEAKIYAVWDAKYRDKPSKQITRDEVYTFSTARGLLPISQSASLKIKLAGIAHSCCFHSCGLISNGNFSSEKDQTLKALGLRETARFGTATQLTRP